MIRPRRTKEELGKALEHLTYELKALQGAFDFFFEPVVERKFSDARLVLEAFLVHTRNLLDFFHGDPTKARPDDMVAQDFLPSPTGWASICPPFPLDLQDTRTAVHKLVAHLTYARVEYAKEEWRWAVPKYRVHLLEAAKAFKARLSPGITDSLIIPETPKDASG